MSTWNELKTNPKLFKIYKTRTEIIRLIREFFWSQNFVETDTPIALKYPSQEPYLNFMPVMMHGTDNTTHPMYLRTSPEFALKKLLAAGFSKIFEIGKCFRDNESFGGTHNPEFSMIEWYRAPGSLSDIMDDMEALFKYVGEKLSVSEVQYKNKRYAICDKWERMTMKEVWQKYASVDLDKYLDIEKLRYLVSERGYSVNENDAYEDLFFKIFLNEIEPKLGMEKPVFVYDYPAQMASLSRLCAHDQRYAERMECYIGGLELCNAFGELTDGDEQKKRLEADKQLRAKLGKPTWPIDEDFIAALRSGIVAPEESDGPAFAKATAGAAGIAMGVDRMVVLFTGAKNINEVIFGSMNDQINN